MTKPSNPKDAIATDKLSLHLVSPIVKAYQAISHFLGNVKYGAWNWRAAGARASVYKSALDRHLDAWWEGEENDPRDGTPHLANALACIGILIDAKHAGKLIDDRPPSNHKGLAEVREQFEALMPKIRECYKDKNPKHYTIADTDLASVSVDGWVETGKGNMYPSSSHTIIEVRTAAGRVLGPVRAGDVSWAQHGMPYDVVAYRLVSVPHGG